MSLLTIRGMYNYHPTLFDGLQVPDYWSKETLIGVILRETDEREVLYSNPTVLESCITHWAKSYLTQWARLAKALEVEYDPLDNFDRHEEYTESHTDSSIGKSNAQSTGKATGFNSNALTAVDGSESSAEANTDVNGVNTHTGRMHGNIGVTTSQQMLQSEIDLRRWNWYNEVGEEFARVFTLGVW